LYPTAQHQYSGQEVETHGPVIREAIEIELHPNNINIEECFSLSRSWEPLIYNLREWKQALNKNMTSSSGR
jgi:hypothetical protein